MRKREKQTKGTRKEANERKNEVSNIMRPYYEEKKLLTVLID